MKTFNRALLFATLCTSTIASAQSESLGATPTTVSPTSQEPEGSASGPISRPFTTSLGLSIPDLVNVTAGYKLPMRTEFTLGFSPGFSYPVTIVAPADEEVIKTRLKAGTPETEFDTKVSYSRNIFATLSWEPLATKRWYVMGGFGYRKMHVTTKGQSDLYVCLVTPDIPCNKDTETFPSRSKINLSADIETVSYNMRGATGWKFEWDNHVFVDWTIIGLVYSKPHSQSITVNSSLETEQTVEEANAILGEMQSYLDKKEESIRSRVVNNVEKVDRLPLPYMGLTVGFNF